MQDLVSQVLKQALCPSAAPVALDTAAAKSEPASKQGATANNNAVAAADSSALAVPVEGVRRLEIHRHVAMHIISSHQAAEHQLSEALTTFVVAFKSEVDSWSLDQQANNPRWTGYLVKLKELKWHLCYEQCMFIKYQTVDVSYCTIAQPFMHHGANHAYSR